MGWGRSEAGPAGDLPRDLSVIRRFGNSSLRRPSKRESLRSGEGSEQAGDAELAENLSLRVLDDEALSPVSRLVPELQKDAHSVEGDEIQLVQLDADGPDSVIHVMALELSLEHLGRNIALKLATQEQAGEVAFTV
jgi:hypothetical protein